MSATVDKDASTVQRDDSSTSDKPCSEPVVKLPAETLAKKDNQDLKSEPLETVPVSVPANNESKDKPMNLESNKGSENRAVAPEAQFPVAATFKAENGMYFWYSPPSNIPDPSVAYPCVPLAAYAPVATEDDHAANMKAIATTLAGLKNARNNEPVPQTLIPASLAASKDSNVDFKPTPSVVSSHAASPVPAISPDTKQNNPSIQTSSSDSQRTTPGPRPTQPVVNVLNTDPLAASGPIKDRLSIQELVRRSKPSMVSIEMSSDRPHECKLLDPWGAVCSRSFKRPYDLQRHQESVHSAGSKSYVCKRCGGPERTFSRQDSLARHMRRMHGAQVFREEVVTSLQPADECKQKRTKFGHMTAQVV